LISIIIPTHNRPESLAFTLAAIDAAWVPGAEVLVVDDGSEPPVAPPADWSERPLRVLRRGGGERSAARNAGAEAASRDLLVFVDDDVRLQPGALAAHHAAQAEWPGALCVGHLPLAEADTPFGRFRSRLEAAEVPAERGPVAATNFCAAGNMSIPRARFRELGGFDATLSSAEDQDLALRHSAAGGRTVYLPEAVGVHWDATRDIRAYCRRTEWGARHLAPFCRRYPDRPDNLVRAAVNGPTRWGREPVSRSFLKTTKVLLAARPALALLFACAEALERRGAEGPLLDRLYRLLLGIHLQRGYRRGLECPG
jgi:glycosyltransferase involved in cell wall biosynthesis